MKRRQFLSTALAGGVASAMLPAPTFGRAQSADQAPSVRPNIVLIYVDDLGYKDLQSYGNDYFETPNIDALLSRGLRFTQAYSSSPLCAPSRIALLTGRHNVRAGCFEVVRGTWNEVRYFLNVERMKPEEINVDWEEKVHFKTPPNRLNLPRGRKILPEYLKEIGYRTGFFGKWHVGPQKPSARGFDDQVTLGRFHLPGAHLDVRKGFTSKSDGYPDPSGTVGDYMTEVSLHFLDSAKESPFFLYMAHPLVHSPFEAEDAIIEKYRSKSTSRFHSNPTYAAMVESLDQSIGRLLDGLRQRNQLENTLIIFTSDNGAVTGPTTPTDDLDGYPLGMVNSHYPLRGGKVQLWEGGIRIPFGITFGDRIPSGTFDGVVSQLDILPTVLEVAGHPDYAGIRTEFDGVSLQTILEDPKTVWGERALFWHFPGYRGLTYKPKVEGREAGYDQRPESVVRRGNWKLFESLETGDVRLYDLQKDIGETTDIADTHPDMAKHLLNELHTWQKETNAPMPLPK